MNINSSQKPVVRRTVNESIAHLHKLREAQVANLDREGVRQTEDFLEVLKPHQNLSLTEAYTASKHADGSAVTAQVAMGATGAGAAMLCSLMASAGLAPFGLVVAVGGLLAVSALSAASAVRLAKERRLAFNKEILGTLESELPSKSKLGDVGRSSVLKQAEALAAQGNLTERSSMLDDLPYLFSVKGETAGEMYWSADPSRSGRIRQLAQNHINDEEGR